MTDKLAVSQEARALADELGTITEERHSIVLAALARFEAQARLAGERAGMERAGDVAENCAIRLYGTTTEQHQAESRAYYQGRRDAIDAILKEAASITQTPTPEPSNG